MKAAKARWITSGRGGCQVSRFPGQYDWLVGGAVGVGETYPAAACRELAKELGVHTPTRFLFKYLCRGVISPYWMGLHEAVLN